MYSILVHQSALFEAQLGPDQGDSEIFKGPVQNGAYHLAATHKHTDLIGGK